MRLWRERRIPAGDGTFLFSADEWFLGYATRANFRKMVPERK